MTMQPPHSQSAASPPSSHAREIIYPHPVTPGSDGDPFGTIYSRHHRHIYRLLRARLGDPDEAADLTQETFLRAYRAFGTFNGAAEQVCAWLVRIATNAARDRHRRARQIALVSWDAAQGAVSMAPDDNPEAAYLSAEEHRAVRLALQALPPRGRRALLLHVRDGLSCAAIGTILGTTPGAVRSLIHSARQQLCVCHVR